MCYFFFSSRRRHTRSDRDWSSDVCSSDLSRIENGDDNIGIAGRDVPRLRRLDCGEVPFCARKEDRKSTRLNSSHDQISYAVFCLKKKKRYNRLRIATSILPRG